MVSQGFQLDADTLVGLVTACGHAGVWEPAQTLCAVAHSMQVRSVDGWGGVGRGAAYALPAHLPTSAWGVGALMV